MEENYMATTRNGHEQKDMYNPEILLSGKTFFLINLGLVLT